jgi:type IV pilus assembly protein PilV
MSGIRRNRHNGGNNSPRRSGDWVRTAAGVTLVELVVATLILAVASLGALTYQYHAVKRAKTARSEITAAQLTQLIIEDWKSNGGSEFYDPLELDLGLESTGTDRLYKMTLNEFPMWIQLWYGDVDTDEAAGVTLREIRVTISWRRDYLDQTPGASDPVFTATTYVRRDQSGG